MSNNGAASPDDIEAILDDIDWNDELIRHNQITDHMNDALRLTQQWMEADSDPDELGVVYPRGSVLFGVYLLLLARMTGYESASDLQNASPEAYELYTQMMRGLLAQGVLIANGADMMMTMPAIAEYLGFESPGG